MKRKRDSKQISEEPVYAIKRIWDRRRVDEGKFEYLIQWENYPRSFDSWSPVENFVDRSILGEIDDAIDGEERGDGSPGWILRGRAEREKILETLERKKIKKTKKRVVNAGLETDKKLIEEPGKSKEEEQRDHRGVKDTVEDAEKEIEPLICDEPKEIKLHKRRKIRKIKKNLIIDRQEVIVPSQEWIVFSDIEDEDPVREDSECTVTSPSNCIYQKGELHEISYQHGSISQDMRKCESNEERPTITEESNASCHSHKEFRLGHIIENLLKTAQERTIISQLPGISQFTKRPRKIPSSREY